jgi:hypothetical protein
LTDEPAVYRKPAPDVYTFLLVIALLAIIVSCVFLYLYMAAYDQKANKGAPRVWMPESGAAHTTLVAWAWPAAQEKNEG